MSPQANVSETNLQCTNVERELKEAMSSDSAIITGLIPLLWEWISCSEFSPLLLYHAIPN
jgi:hypothetical protein